MGNSRRFRNSVGPQIRKHRDQLGLTQDALATRLQLGGLDMDRTALAKIESRIRSVFDFELPMIAEALNVPIETLFPSKRELRKILPALMQGKAIKQE